MSIILMINYARSGGTILSKCLASLENTVLISEVNPKANALYSIQEQSLKWYNIKLKQNNYIKAVLELYEICNKKNKKLIIRDWTFIDFTPCHQNNFSPSYKLSHLEMLKKETEVIPFCFIRDAIDIWISRWMPPHFFPHYKKYVEAALNANLPLYKFEDFCEEPESLLKAICNQTSLDYSENYKNYIHYNNITGDNTAPLISRGQEQKLIYPLKRKNIPTAEIKKVNGNTDMIEANKIAGYSLNYFDKPIDRSRNILLNELKFRIRRALSIPPKDLY